MACSKDLVNLSIALVCASNCADIARNLSSIVGDLSDIVASCVGDNSGVGGESSDPAQEEILDVLVFSE